MARLLVDTNVVSYRHKKDSRAALYEPLLAGHGMYVAFSAVAELYEWAIRRRWVPAVSTSYATRWKTTS